MKCPDPSSSARSPKLSPKSKFRSKVLLKHSRLAICYEPDAGHVKMRRGKGALMKGLRAEEPRLYESALRRPSSFTDRAESFPISQILIFISINSIFIKG